MAQIEPAVTQLVYVVPQGDSYIDLAKDLSRVNRRLYRQGFTYVVQDIQVGVAASMRATDIHQFTFSTSGNSWIVHNAWKKGYEAWRNQVKSVTSQADGGDGPHGRHIHGLGMGAIEGKWADFKVYLDDSMEDGTTLEPYAGDAAVYVAGEWDYSALVFDDDGTERDLKMHLIGGSNLADTNEESGIGLIHEYAHSRRQVQAFDPDVEAEVSDTIYAKLWGTDEMSDRLVDNIESANDQSPYSQEHYPGGDTNADAAVLVRVGAVSAAQSVGNFAGFIAPCGLIKVQSAEISLTNTTETLTDISDAATAQASPGPNSVYTSGTPQDAVLVITVAPGPYRGVLAAPMGQ